MGFAKQASVPITLTVHYTAGRSSNHTFHTLKAARHYAKNVCNSPSVVRITAKGGDLVGLHMLYG